MNQWSEDLIAIDRARTLDGLFLQRTIRSPERVAYRYHERGDGWKDLTWGDMSRWVARWRQALSGESLEPGDRVAVLLRNCPEWVMFDQAAFSLGLVTVPLYTDDRADNAAYILQDAAVKVLLIQDAGRWRRLAEAIGESSCPSRVVILESSQAAQDLAREDPRVLVSDQWLPDSAPGLQPRMGDPRSLATIVYTSGTTGRPKGVMLSHYNILTNAHAVLTLINVYREDVFLSFLPLSHMLERTGGYYLPLMSGSTVVYSRSIAQLAEDLQTIRPTVVIAVPRVFERIYQRIADQLETKPAAVRWMFDLAVSAGWRAFLRKQGRAGWHPKLLLWPLLRRKVGAPVMERLGGRMRAAVSGGAALPTGVAQTFIGLGLPLIQGYGLTETSPVVSFNPLEKNIPESVGVPIRGIQVRIGADDELQVKGDNVMMGYWNNHAATTEVLSQDGWFHTGDQAHLENGHIYITGRLKDILVLSNGEKVPPGDLEMAIGMDPLFDQVVVLGEGHSYLTALLVLNADLWGGLAREYGLDPEHPASLEDSPLHKGILKRIRFALRDFPGYTKIRRITLTLEPWSIDNGLLTPTLKIKRNKVVERYREAIEFMYSMDS
ncbi:AMP-dependent synthetase/ligase [Imhoffiella purpurea]|uniref:Long-chain-fatty-acid--CoA ligase n=1 Tax=Imhoffiella purpurea TaxID=1249627 RepID=W9VB25_9GAMM|nr:AMP-dependent synthetase/ligase [Imhoffiella purpurea]EXJ13247.1 Long-chain-fatty-acid--CoA ligase [Imhoffiella purpurea]